MFSMKWGKVTLIILGAVIITSLGIDATDTINGSRGTLLSQIVGGIDSNNCPKGMSSVENIGAIKCVDIYEASVGESCPNDNPTNIIDSLKNIENSSCEPVSKEDVIPWRFITRDQAMQACARVGKRLPTNAEWYQLSLGMADTENNCNVSSGSLNVSGKNTLCISPSGAYDLVGNVWEWVSDDIIDGLYNNRTLPPTGYVSQIDVAGMAVVSSSTEIELFGKDYFWSKADGAYGIIRGGFYDSGTDAGIYTVHADTLPTVAGTAIGFRCVK